MNNKEERIKMVKAMEYIARQINDEDIFDYWLSEGVADGDIKYGDLSDEITEDLEWYLEPDNFQDLMKVFERIVAKVYRTDTGFFCGGVVS